MSDTPETDEARFEVRERGNPIPIEVVAASKCAGLERERDEARRERDEYKMALESADKGNNDLHVLLEKTREELDEAQRERDALREALRFYADGSRYPWPLTGGMGDLYQDHGCIARTALESVKGGSHE